MYNTFNMGLGMCLTVRPEDADGALEILTANGARAYRAGEIIPRTGEESVLLV
jgi:phosphoribosylformylglycinamidine cyclo-ligase